MSPDQSQSNQQKVGDAEIVAWINSLEPHLSKNNPSIEPYVKVGLSLVHKYDELLKVEPNSSNMNGFKFLCGFFNEAIGNGVSPEELSPYVDKLPMLVEGFGLGGVSALIGYPFLKVHFAMRSDPGKQQQFLTAMDNFCTRYAASRSSTDIDPITSSHLDIAIDPDLPICQFQEVLDRMLIEGPKSVFLSSSS